MSAHTRRLCRKAECPLQKNGPHYTHPVTTVPPRDSTSAPAATATRGTKRTRGEAPDPPASSTLSTFPAPTSPGPEIISPSLLTQTSESATGSLPAGAGSSLPRTSPAPPNPPLAQQDQPRSLLGSEPPAFMSLPQPPPSFASEIGSNAAQPIASGSGSTFARSDPPVHDNAPPQQDIPVGVQLPESENRDPSIETTEEQTKGKQKRAGKGSKDRRTEKGKQKETTGGEDDEGRLTRKEAREERIKTAAWIRELPKRKEHFQTQSETIMKRIPLMDAELDAVNLVLLSHPNIHGPKGTNRIPYYKVACSATVKDPRRKIDFTNFELPSSAIPFVLPEDEPTHYSRRAIYKTILELWALIVEDEQKETVRVSWNEINRIKVEVEERKREKEENERRQQLLEEQRREAELSRIASQRATMEANGFSEELINQILSAGTV